LQVNSPVSAALRWLCLRPAEENITSFGRSETALKKEYGARLIEPSLPLLPIQPMGRGATIALNGSCAKPCRLVSVV
jgi:hypothetical protein